MLPPALRAAPPSPSVDTSPLGAARVRRRMTVEEVAARSGLSPDDVACLEEGRIYRFPSVHDALAATLVYAATVGITEREARRLAGLPVPPLRSWTIRRTFALLAFVGASLALVLAFGGNVLREEPPGSRTAVATPRLPPPWEIRVDVFNGTDVSNAATQLANEIGGPLAYRLGTVENANRTDYLETRVYYPPGSLEIAARLADDLGVETAALPGGDDPHRLVVIVGRDRAAVPAG